MKKITYDKSINTSQKTKSSNECNDPDCVFIRGMMASLMPLFNEILSYAEFISSKKGRKKQNLSKRTATNQMAAFVLVLNILQNKIDKIGKVNATHVEEHKCSCVQDMLAFGAL